MSLEGVSVQSSELEPLSSPRVLHGLNISINPGLPYTPPRVLFGVTVNLPLNLPVSVRDPRGRGIQGALVVADNGGTPFECNTDKNGNCLLEATNPTTITVTWGHYTQTAAYSGQSSMTFVFQIPIYE